MEFLLIAALLYFLPSIIGHGKRNFGAIFLVNFFLGWTIVGWIVALVWACAAGYRQPVFAFAGPAPIPSAGGSRFCSHCGARALSAAHFCWSCGHTV